MKDKNETELYVIVPPSVLKKGTTKKETIGPQFVRVATAFLFALVCEYGAA